MGLQLGPSAFKPVTAWVAASLCCQRLRLTAQGCVEWHDRGTCSPRTGFGDSRSTSSLRHI